MSFTLWIRKRKQRFLNIDVTRCDNLATFKPSLYREPIFSGMYTNFKSFLANKNKYSLISSLLFRVCSICSDYGMISDEIKELKVIWLKNGVPMSVMDRIVFNFLNKLFIPKKVVLTVPRKQLFVSLNFIGKQSLFCYLKNYNWQS